MKKKNHSIKTQYAVISVLKRKLIAVNVHIKKEEISTITFYLKELEKREYFKCHTMASHSSTLAWQIPWTEEPAGLQSMGSVGVRHD